MAAFFIGLLAFASVLMLRQPAFFIFTIAGFFLNGRSIRNAARDLIAKYRVKTPSPGTPIRNLSGGNVQRAVLARVWQALLDSEPSAVVRTPATLLGVRHLGYEGQLVEIECTAALPLDPLRQEPG